MAHHPLAQAEVRGRSPSVEEPAPSAIGMTVTQSTKTKSNRKAGASGCWASAV